MANTIFALCAKSSGLTFNVADRVHAVGRRPHYSLFYPVPEPSQPTSAFFNFLASPKHVSHPTSLSVQYLDILFTFTNLNVTSVEKFDLNAIRRQPFHNSANLTHFDVSTSSAT
jgi:hypothetical protein